MIDGLDFVNSSQHPSDKSLIFISTYVNNRFTNIMIDTGSQHSFINKNCLREFDKFQSFEISPQNFFMADGVTTFQVKDTIRLNISIGAFNTTAGAFVTTHLCTDMILGMDYLSQYDIEINTKKNIITFNFDKEQVILSTNFESLAKQHSSSISKPIQSLINQQFHTSTLSSISNLEQIISNLASHMTDQTQHDKLKSLLLRFQSTFDTSKYTIAKTEIFHAIETETHTPPVSKHYPGSPTLNAELRKIVDKLLDAGLVANSQSAYAAPALLVKKKDKSWRLVIDYKKLNSVTIKDNYPLPNMELTLQILGRGYSYFSKIDLRSGFWQLPIDPKDRFKTAFTTPFGLFEWLVLPQGLRNSPPTFQRTMNRVLSSCSEFSLVYLDDIVIYSCTFDEHLVHIEKVLSALKEHNLTLAPAKCELAKQSIEYLGHVISSKTIAPLPDRIKSIISLPEPKTLTQANKFIGSLSWYRKFIPAFATIAAPIHATTNLTKQNRHKFHWGIEQSKSFTTLKQLLTSSPMFLDFPVDGEPIFLATDASIVGIGGVLYQETQGEKRILYYHSELLTPAQKRYHPLELEALAIFKCINRMKSFLLGREIFVYTDNCPICHMMDKKISNKRVEKISILLQEFNIRRIIHVKGEYNCLPDYLSRHPIEHDDEFLNSNYGLEFVQDNNSSIQIAGAVVTRSKAKALPSPSNSSQSDLQSTTSLTSSTSNLVNYSEPELESVDILFDLTQIKQHQSEDTQIQHVIEDLKTKADLSFEISDGILYKLTYDANRKKKDKLIYIPSSMINSILTAFHDNSLVGGHFGIRRTFDKLKEKFWWPNMKKSVSEHIRSCISCQAFNVSRQKAPGFLNPTTIPEGPNLLLGMDFCGPFPTTPQSNRYVLCLTDYFTKFIFAVALPNCTAITTATAIFNDYICRFGVPRTIISDQGTSFKNQLMDSLSKLLGYKHIFCTAYRPQSNGAVERFNSTFVTQLAKLTDRELNNWDCYLNPIIFAYNTGIHASTNFSPFELTFGRKPNLPTDLYPTTFTFEHHHDYLQQLIVNLEYYHRTAKEIMLKQQKLTKNRYDLRRTNPHYELGAIVLTRVFTNRSKLDPRYSTTPKIIIQQQHPIYYVQDSKTNVISRVHVADIRPLFSQQTR